MWPSRATDRPGFRRAICGCIFVLLAGWAYGLGEETKSPPAPQLVVVQPGYPGSSRDAEPFLRRLARYLGEKASWEELRCAYYNEPEKAIDSLQKAPAACGIVSLGFYLQNRKQLGLQAVLESRPEERFYLVAPSSAGDTEPADLAGQLVVGGPLFEYEFLRRIVFADRNGVDRWKPAPSLRISRSLRRLERGEYRAAVLNEREFRTLEKLGRTKSLEIIDESEYYPPALFVLFQGGGGDEPEDRKEPKDRGRGLSAARRVGEALERLDDDPEGKKILETMGNEGFRPVRSEWLEKLEKRYNVQEK